MSMWRHLRRWLGTDGYEPDRDARPDYVHASVIHHHERHALSRGVDLPTWRTPKEVAQMRRVERRAALRLAKGA